MKKIINENRLYLSLIAVFLLASAILLANIEQGDVILFFSDHRSIWGDTFFRYFTKMGEEIIYLIALAGLLIYRLRYAMLVPLMGILVTIVSFIGKSYFLHYRPSVYFKETLSQINLVEGVHLLSGPTSFPSGHTMSAFAMYGLLALFLPRKKAWMVFFLFLMAVGVGVSRMYLVQHFLKDVISGAFTGTLLALLVYYLQTLIPAQAEGWLDKGIWEVLSGKKTVVDRA